MMTATTTLLHRQLALLPSSSNRGLAARAWFGSSSTDWKRRKAYEEQHHLGRTLSRRMDISPEVKKKWKAMAKKWDHQWKHPPLQDKNRYTANYEFDALESIHKRSFQANVLLEIRDVRLPASTHHPSFTRLARHRTHLICYTHSDLIDASTRDRVEQWTQQSWPDSDCMFVDTQQNRGDAENFEELYDWIIRIVEQKGGVNSALTVGVPNTGKSSVLLSLLRTARQRGLVPKTVKVKRSSKQKGLKKSAPPGILDVPGETREVTEYLIRDKPRMFFLDVPGMTPPHFYFAERPEAWYGYGAANLLPMSKSMSQDSTVQRSFCEYVLYCANRDRIFQYVHKLNLEEPTPDIDQVLARLSNKYANRLGETDLLLKRCETFLKLFNTGNLGPRVLDDISRPYQAFKFKDKHFAQNQEAKGDSFGTKQSGDSVTNEDDDVDWYDDDSRKFRGKKKEFSEKDASDPWYDDYEDWLKEKKDRSRERNH